MCAHFRLGCLWLCVIPVTTGGWTDRRGDGINSLSHRLFARQEKLCCYYRATAQLLIYLQPLGCSVPRPTSSEQQQKLFPDSVFQAT